jgi:hypothetical protein
VSKRLAGPALAVVTALVTRRGLDAQALVGQTGCLPDEVAEGIAWLEGHGLVEAVPGRKGGAGIGLTVAGLGEFYCALGAIRDALAPSHPAPSLPFTVQTTWRECLCFNYLVRPEALRRLVPQVLDLVTHAGRAIVSVTAASLGSMRPTGLPEIAGQNFCNVTYRAIVRFTNTAGARRVGYHFIASLANNELMGRIGNSVTEFKFHEFRTGPITFLRQGSTLVVGAEGGAPELKMVAAVDLAGAGPSPPQESAFSSREELDRLVIDHADAFGHYPGESHVYVLRVDRDPWNYHFVSPRQLYLAYFQEGQPFDSESARLDSVLYCRNVGYRWQPLRREAVGVAGNGEGEER